MHYGCQTLSNFGICFVFNELYWIVFFQSCYMANDMLDISQVMDLDWYWYTTLYVAFLGPMWCTEISADLIGYFVIQFVMNEMKLAQENNFHQRTVKSVLKVFWLKRGIIWHDNYAFFLVDPMFRGVYFGKSKHKGDRTFYLIINLK